MSTYYAILTAVGEAKLANATALGTQLQVSRMGVGDGGGVLPTPNRNQTELVGEWYRADLNELIVDPVNASQIRAELVIPETEGGFWIREMGLYDAAGELIAVSNCPPSYKPQMAEGSGRTQVLRMVLIVSSTAAVQLKIDPSVVLATREFVTTTVAAELAKLDTKHSVKAATTANLAALSGLLTVDGVALTAGARVLVKDQATASQNGIYVVAAGAWARAADADLSAEVSPGLLVAVEAGTENADTVWQLTSDGPITLGATSLTFTLTAAPNASQADAEVGTDNIRRMTALRVFQAMRSATGAATELLRGVLRVGTQEEVNGGTSDGVAVTPLKLRHGLLYNFGENGYFFLPSFLTGFGFQWGTSQGTSDGMVSTPFPIAFPNKCFVVMTNDNDVSVSPAPRVSAISLTGFTAFADSNGFWYLSVGH